MKYEIVATNKKHSVVEIKSQLTVFTTCLMPLAVQICDNLNSGGGFDGFTPSFFTKTC